MFEMEHLIWIYTSLLAALTINLVRMMLWNFRDVFFCVVWISQSNRLQFIFYVFNLTMNPHIIIHYTQNETLKCRMCVSFILAFPFILHAWRYTTLISLTYPFTFSAPLTLITLRKFVIDVYLLTLGSDKWPEGGNAPLS